MAKPLPKLIMLPIGGEYKIIPLPKKQNLLESILSFAAVWITLLMLISFCSRVIWVTYARLP